MKIVYAIAGFFVLAISSLSAVEVGAVPGQWTIGGIVDLNYIKNTGEGSTHDAYFETVNTEFRVAGHFSNGVAGKLILDLPEQSAGLDTGNFVIIEELWVEKDQVFGYDNMRIRFGKMEIPCTMNYNADIGITRNLSDGSPYAAPASGVHYDGPGRIDYTYGGTFGYDLGLGYGEIMISSFEGSGGVTTDHDNDPGIFKSYAAKWENYEDAFGVNGFGFSVGFARISLGYGVDAITLATLGLKGEFPEKNVSVALEYSQTKYWLAEGGTVAVNVFLTDAAEDDAATLISLNVNYDKNPILFIFMWERLAGKGDVADTLTRMSFLVEYALAGDYAVVAQLSDYKYSETDDVDQTQWAAGVRGEF